MPNELLLVARDGPGGLLVTWERFYRLNMTFSIFKLYRIADLWPFLALRLTISKAQIVPKVNRRAFCINPRTVNFVFQSKVLFKKYRSGLVMGHDPENFSKNLPWYTAWWRQYKIFYRVKTLYFFFYKFVVFDEI